MRRDFIKSLQKKSTAMFGEEKKPKMLASLHRQNAFARKYGLTLITIMLNVLLASIVITVTYTYALELYQSGLLKGPNAAD